MDGTILGKKYDIINGEGGGGGKLTPATADTLGGIKIGNGLSVTEDGTASVNFPPAPEPYVLPTASAETLGGVKGGGDYIAINESGIVSVNKSLPYVGYSYNIVTTNTGSSDAAIKVIKKSGDTIISETEIAYAEASTPRNFDDRFTISYSNGWSYTNIEASVDHPSGWTKVWAYNTEVNFTERFDNSGETLALVKQVNAIKNAIISASSFADAQSKLAQL